MMASSSFVSEPPAEGLDASPLGASAPALILVAQNGEYARAAEEAALFAAATVVRRSDFQQLDDTLSNLVGVDVLLVEAAGSDPEMLERLLHWSHAAVAASDAGLVLCFDQDQLDQVVLQASGLDAQLLCQPGTAERVAALTIARRRQLPKFNGFTENEGDRLRRLSEEVARIAEALTRLSAKGLSGTSRRDGFGHEPESTGALPHERDAAPQPESEEVPLQASAVRAIIRARRLRGQFFDAQLFADPAWDMLLDLTAARLEKASVSVSSLCIAAAVPPTTALRWITTMIDAGLFERQDDPHDRRRAYVGLTNQAFEGMQAYTAALRRIGLHVL